MHIPFFCTDPLAETAARDGKPQGRRSRARWWRPVAGVALLCALAGRAELLVQVGQNFTGSVYPTDSPYFPADANGAVGPAHFVEMVNGRFSVYTKSNASQVQSMTTLDFWTRAGLTFSSNLDISDPRLIFDPAVQRWFAASIDINSANQVSNRFLVAVSATADPTGTWKAVGFMADSAGNFADFPTLGLDAKGVYLGGDLFDSAGNEQGSLLVSIPKTNLLAATPTAQNRTTFNLGSTYGWVVQPAINFGPATSAQVLAVGDLGYDFNPHNTLVGFSVQNANLPGASHSLGTVITVDPYSVPINPFQPDGSSNLDDGDTRFSASVWQVGDVLYAVHSTEVNNRAAVRWYKIDANTYAVIQSGTIADPSLEYFYPSIAANAAGTVVIAFNGCSRTTFISSYAVVGETVGGTITFGSPMLLQSGLASYQAPGGGTSRWGDYSATSVDPVDPNRFWTIQLIASGSSAWSTQITEIRTDHNPTLAIAASATQVTVSWPATTIQFALEWSTDPSSAAVWTPVSQAATIANGVASVRLAPEPGAQFFRLRQQ